MVKTVELHSAWHGSLAGGCISNPLWWDNPQFRLYPSCDASFTVELTPLHDKLCTGIIVLHGVDGPPMRGSLGSILSQTHYQMRKVHTTTLKLAPMPRGKCYFLLPTTYEAGKESPFTIKVTSTEDAHFRFEAASLSELPKPERPKQKDDEDHKELGLDLTQRTASEILLQSKAYVSGQAYEGEWENGKYHGIGSFFYNDGQQYIGEWKAGQKHGHGTLRTSDGTLLRGIWHEGEVKQLWPIDSPLFVSYVLDTFNAHDYDGNGQLSTLELRSALRRLGLNTSAASAMEVMQAFDTDSDRCLSLTEFAELVRKMCAYLVKQREAQQAAAGFSPVGRRSHTHTRARA